MLHSLSTPIGCERCPLLFKYITRALGRGVSVDYLSIYPKEREYLYPPLCVSPSNRNQQSVPSSRNQQSNPRTAIRTLGTLRPQTATAAISVRSPVEKLSTGAAGSKRFGFLFDRSPTPAD